MRPAQNSRRIPADPFAPVPDRHDHIPRRPARGAVRSEEAKGSFPVAISIAYELTAGAMWTTGRIFQLGKMLPKRDGPAPRRKRTEPACDFLSILDDDFDVGADAGVNLDLLGTLYSLAHSCFIEVQAGLSQSPRGPRKPAATRP